MENPKISVIVPIYKAEAYLHQCVDSILAQTYTNLEVILVNDGSPDDCGKICDEYAKRDGRVIVIHKENGGQSSARNAGLDIATGELLGFVDSDDWIEIDMYESLYNNLVNYNTDISCCDLYYVYKNSTVRRKHTNEIVVRNREQALEAARLSTNDQGMCGSCWDKLYKKYIYDGIRFPIGKIYEDIYILPLVLEKANLVVWDDTPKYYYRQRKSSTVRLAYAPGKVAGSNADLNDLSMYDNAHKAAALVPKLGMLSQMVFVKNYKKLPEYKSTLSALRKNYKLLLQNNYLKPMGKMKIIALKINVDLFKLLQATINAYKSRRLFD